MVDDWYRFLLSFVPQPELLEKAAFLRQKIQLMALLPRRPTGHDPKCVTNDA